MKFPVLLSMIGLGVCLGTTTPSRADDYVTSTFEGGPDLSFSITYDTSIPRTRSTDPVAGTDEISGGLSFGTAPVITSAILTSGSTTLSFTPDYYADIYTSRSFADFYAYDTAGNEFQVDIRFNGQGSTNLDTPFTGLQGEGNAQGGEIAGYIAPAGSDPINFDVAVAAPEPSTWALMLSGVAIAGAGLRWSRRRRQAPLAATAA